MSRRFSPLSYLRRWRTLLPAGAALVLLSSLGCAGLQTSQYEALLEPHEKTLEQGYKQARAAWEANPAETEAGFAYARALIDTRRFPEAFDLALKLADQVPADPRLDLIKAEALQGMGNFEAAIDRYALIFEKNPEDQEALRNATLLLLATGRGELILAQLKGSEHHNASMLQVLEASFLASRQANQARKGDHTLESPSPVIETALSDNYFISMEIQGVKARIRFSTGASGFFLADTFLTRIKASAAGERQVTDRRDSGSTTVKQVVLETVELGGARLKGLRATVLENLDSSGMGRSNSGRELDGILGPDVFAGYSYRIDRKGGKLEFFAPEVALPPAAQHAVTQPFYTLGPFLVTDGAVVNRAREKSTPVKLIVSTGYSGTSYDLLAASRDDFGNLDTTRQVVTGTGLGYGRAVALTFTSLQMGGVQWRQDLTVAERLQPLGYFTPQGTVGADVLKHFRITVDQTLSLMTFELYPGPDFPHAGPLPTEGSPGLRSAAPPQQ